VRCAIALETIVAGRYTSTYNAVDTGISQEGYNLDQGSKAEMLAASDAFGESAFDAIYRGGDVFMNFECVGYKAGTIAPFWPWGALGVMHTTAAPIGRRASDVAVPHVLTAVANTPAAASPASVTGVLAILAPNNSAKLLFSSKVRIVPVRLQYLPYDAGSGNIKWFV
jgi:hypothetical protein